MSPIAKLEELRRHGGAARTTGLADAVIERFAATDADLVAAIDEAHASFTRLRDEMPELLQLDEAAQLARVQADFVNFYADDAINPYVALAGRGPWVVTLKGAVVHDVGGYGMLGLGHAPQAVIDALAGQQVMANVMTPNLSQLRFAEALKREIGQERAGGSPYAKFLCLNSGSEAVTLACRFADVNSKLLTDTGARYAGRTIKRLAVKGAFHGRTEKPAIYSDSSRKAYQQHLASFRDERSLITVEPYNVDQLRQAFADADKNGWFIEAMFLEPVMGEGDPGRAVTRGVLRRRARTHARSRFALSRRFDPGGPARARRALGRRLSGLREARPARHGDLLEGAQRRPVSAVGARRVRIDCRAVPEGHLRQHDDDESARARCGLRGARLDHAGVAREHPREGCGIHRQVAEAAEGTAGPHHEGAGHGSAVLVRTRAAVQVLRRREHRGMDARARHRA